MRFTGSCTPLSPTSFSLRGPSDRRLPMVYSRPGGGSGATVKGQSPSHRRDHSHPTLRREIGETIGGRARMESSN
jgi:hypothetical protein